MMWGLSVTILTVWGMRAMNPHQATALHVLFSLCLGMWLMSRFFEERANASTFDVHQDGDNMPSVVCEA